MGLLLTAGIKRPHPYPSALPPGLMTPLIKAAFPPSAVGETLTAFRGHR